MATKLKIPFGLRDSALVHISEVESGSEHGAVCPDCQRPLIARKGSKTRHHFAHHADVQCNPETVLHKIAKMLLSSQLESALIEKKEIPLTWTCSWCQEEHTGNLLRKARSVLVEHALQGCRPDLTLFDEHDTPVVIIEIVVSHHPEEHVREFCRRNGIGLLEYHINTDDDVESLRALTNFRATIGSVCVRKKCPLCKAPVRSVMLHVVEGNCWKCNCSMKIAFSECEGMMSGPPSFGALALQVARQRGAILRERFSNVVKERYLANTCGNCGSFVGEHYLHDFWYSAQSGPPEVVGYECPECDWKA